MRVHYTGVTWEDSTVFDTTWDAEPASLDLETMLPGFAEALDRSDRRLAGPRGHPAGPGYGDQAQGQIPADSTLVFVIDILGIDQPAAAADAG